MADYGLMLSWGVPVAGREKKALEVFMEGQEVFDKAKANGAIASFETVLLQPTGGGTPGGYTVAWGERDQMDDFANSEAFGRLVQRASLIVGNVALTRAARGNVIMEGMALYGQAIDELS